MNRLALFCTLLFAAAQPWRSCFAAPKPNVVLIVADDMGYADMGAFGCKDFKTPNLDRIAASGVRFTDAYVSGPICVPSRMGILMGRHQQRWGVYGNNDGYTADGMRLTAGEHTFAELFQKAGYATALFGKWHLCGKLTDAPKENRPEEKGFDEVTVITGGMSSYMKVKLYSAGGREEPAPEYLTDHFGKLSVDFIQRKKGKPFLLCLTFNAVHAPLQAVDADVQQHGEIANLDRRTYAGMMSAMDRNVGRVLDALAASGLEENTIVAFLSDNGGPAPDAAGHSRNMANNRPLRGHKFDVLEGGIRTPMLMRWPGKIPAGQTFAGVSSSMDLSATFLAAAGLAAHPGKPLDGVDLLPFLNGKATRDPHPSLFWESNWFTKPDCAVRRGNWKLVQLRTGPQGPEAGKWELYDLSRDVGEADNVAQKHPQIVQELDAAFRAWRAEMVPACTSGKAHVSAK